MIATDTRQWTISFSALGTFVQVVLTEVQDWEERDGETWGTRDTVTAWEAAKSAQPNQIVVVAATGTTVYHNNGTTEHFPAADMGNLLEAELAERESKADEAEAKVEETSRVGKVFTDGETVYRVKKSAKGYLSAYEWDGEEWTKAWGYKTSTWRPLTADEAAEFGHSTHHCVNCYRPLSDERSTSVGYGPICAEKNSWPWGE
jgi:hypothetical protein